jgi:CRP-like cAMP-binding protein
MTRSIVKPEQACLDELFDRLDWRNETLTRQVAVSRMLDAACKYYGVGQEPHEAAAVRPLLIVLSGWACEQRISSEDRRQIFNFIAPGDFIDVQAAEDACDYTTIALTPLKVFDVGQMLNRDRSSADPVWARITALAQKIHRQRLYDHLTRLVHKSAYERVAHMLLDLHKRLSSVGMAQGRRFTLPLTQEMLADALGITLVHVNRVLQQLRQQGLIEFSGGVVTLVRPRALALIADFEIADEGGATPQARLGPLGLMSA